jgi:uncharacterized membrane protein YfcA
MPHLTPLQWLLAVVAAMGIGMSKAGFAGIGIFHVLVFALLFGARDSTGIVLPMLLVGDVAAVATFRQHARWDYVWRMLPPTCLGVVLTTLVMARLDEHTFKPLIGWIMLGLTVMQGIRMQWLALFQHIPHSRAFAWTMGLFAGMTTMLANAAGPIFGIYGVAVGLPKLEFVGTMAWFFLLVNAFKVPFSLWLGLIHGRTLTFNAMMIPAILIGLVIGRAVTRRIPQKLFDWLLLTFAAIAALRLILG